jgi:hypothetical protein
MRKQVDKKRIVGLTFKERDKVYLLQVNLRTKKLSNKLNSLRVGLFKVLAKTRPINYKLKLLALIKIHLRQEKLGEWGECGESMSRGE